ncbi:MAG TPA: DUF5330 domain-containing protein [Xanthobacteraceae bacterium]|nr:DUF5330 domain-containing protein [Xanthobacteraceae bacterium]
MFFLLRVAFWLAIVVMLLPTGQSQQQDKATSSLGAAEAIGAAAAAVADLRQFCSRQPEACAVGAQAAHAFGHKAQAGAKMLYDFLAARVAETNAGADPAGRQDAEAARTRDTLTDHDRAPAWRGPAPQPARLAAGPA